MMAGWWLGTCLYISIYIWKNNIFGISSSHNWQFHILQTGGSTTNQMVCFLFVLDIVGSPCSSMFPVPDHQLSVPHQEWPDGDLTVTTATLSRSGLFGAPRAREKSCKCWIPHWVSSHVPEARLVDTGCTCDLGMMIGCSYHSETAFYAS